jgi:hypothetical protein
MQPAPQAPRTPATGHDTYRTDARRSTKPSAQCENRPSHQTQYPRFLEFVPAWDTGYSNPTGRRRSAITTWSGTRRAA